MRDYRRVFFFFFNDTATTEIYTLSLHDALPICAFPLGRFHHADSTVPPSQRAHPALDRKSTRLNSSHQIISYAVFCLKKKKKTTTARIPPRRRIDKGHAPSKQNKTMRRHLTASA